MKSVDSAIETKEQDPGFSKVSNLLGVIVLFLSGYIGIYVFSFDRHIRPHNLGIQDFQPMTPPQWIEIYTPLTKIHQWIRSSDFDLKPSDFEYHP